MATRPKRGRIDDESSEGGRVARTPPLPASSPALTAAEARQLIRAEMEAAHSRIDALLSRVGSSSSSRAPLVPATAPAQAQADNTTNSTDVCTSCAALQTKLDEMQKQAAIHREERRAWQQFKTWWLNSLSKHQQRKHSVPSAPHSSSVDDVRPRSTRQDPVSHMIAGLDSDARRIWEQAGVMSAVERLDESAVESEPALALYPPVTSTNGARATTSRITHYADPPTPHVSTSSPRMKTKPAPLIRTTQPRTPTTQLRTAPSAVGFIDDAPQRNKHARRSMIAHDCPDCALFYSHFDNRVGGASTERQACSRHRTTFQRATTPQGYWNIGFPTTQDAEEINQHARQQHHQSRS